MVIRTLHGIWLHSSLIYLSSCLLFYGMQAAGIAGRMTGVWWHVACGGLSLFLGWVIVRSSQPRLSQVLIDIDRRLKLQDRLSTAYEYIRHHPDNEFTGLLIHDAADSLRPYKMQSIMPIRLSRRHGAAIVMLLTTIFLYSEIWNSTGNEPTARQINSIENAGKLVKKYAIRRIDKRDHPSSTSTSTVAVKMDQLRRSLQDRTKTFEQQIQAVYQFRQEVRGERARLEDALDRKLESANIRTTSAPEITAAENLSADQMENLKSFLNDRFKNRPPDSVTRDIEMLQDLQRIEDLVAGIINDLEENRTTAGISDETSGLTKPENRSADSNRMPRHGQNLDNMDLPKSERKPLAAGPNRSRGAGNSGRDEDSPADDPGQTGRYSASAGRAPSDAGKRSGDTYQGSQGPMARETPGFTPAKNYLIQIRALTQPGDARLPTVEISKSYRREIESVLQKEDIPPNYREYIKNYFHSIGIKTEKEAHENR